MSKKLPDHIDGLVQYLSSPDEKATVLPRLSRMNASVAQLVVPVLATLGGIFWLVESLTLRLAVLDSK